MTTVGTTGSLPDDARPARVRRLALQDTYLLVLFAVALFARASVVLFPADAFMGTGLLYDQLGLRIAVGLGMGPTAVLPPLYPEYLGLVYRIYGYSHVAVVLSHALLGSLTAVLAAVLVRHVGLGRKYAALAGLLVALFPQALAQTRHLSPQVLIGFLFLAGTVHWIRSRPLPGPLVVAIAGTLFGVCLLGRAGMIVPIVAVVLLRGRFRGGWWRRFRPGSGPAGGRFGGRSRSGRARSIAIRAAVLGLALGIAVPWMVRNSRVYDEPVLIDSTWAMRTRAATIPGTHHLDFKVPGRTTTVADHMEVLENRLALAEVIGFTLTEPGTVLGVWLRRLQHFVSFSGWNDSATRDRFPYDGRAYQTAQAVVFGTLLTLALAWLVLLRGRGDRERLCAATFLGFAALAAVGDGPGDARLYALPFLAVLAMRGGWGVLVLSRARVFASPSPVPLPFPSGVEAVSSPRVLVWVLASLAAWVHGVWFV